MNAPDAPSHVARGVAPRVVLLMGVSGSGKTTVGLALAARLRVATGDEWRFEDADTYHDPQSVARMARGEALTDADRAPWLARLAALVRDRLEVGPPTVLACSALKAAYRETLTGGDARVVTFWLDAPDEVLKARLATRKGNPVGPSLLPSQLATLEAPADAVRLDATQTVDGLVDEALAVLRDRLPGTSERPIP